MPAAPEPWHGTVNGYTNRKCRCELCKRAWADYHASRRKAARQKTEIGK